MNDLVKLGTVCCILACQVASALAAQEVPVQTDARSQLETRKAQLTGEFDMQERACSAVFAVTDCVKSVSTKRRAAMAAVRREESALNDRERRERARDRLQSLQEKALQKAQRGPASGDTTAETLEQRLRRQQERLSNHAPQSAIQAPREPKRDTQIDAQTRQQNAADYAARQNAAAERRLAREKKLKDQGKPPADLPTPP